MTDDFNLPGASRRHVVLAAMGLLGGAAFAPVAHAATGSFRATMPSIFLNQGVWEGVYRKVSGALKPIDEYRFRIEISLRDDGSPSYRETARYDWPDGHGRDVLVLADFRDGALVWSDKTSTGRVIEIAPQVSWMEMKFAADPGLDVMEIGRIAPDGSARSRVSVLSRQGNLEALYVADEHRVR